MFEQPKERKLIRYDWPTHANHYDDGTVEWLPFHTIPKNQYTARITYLMKQVNDEKRTTGGESPL